MEYQEQKMKAIGCLTVISMALTLLLTVSLIYPDGLQSFVQHLPFPGWRDKYVLLGILFTLVPVCWAVNLTLILTSPEQEVRLVSWSKRWLKTTSDFEKITFDELDPDYRKSAWSYFWARKKGGPL